MPRLGAAWDRLPAGAARASLLEPVALLRTLAVENDFPRLPVRDEHVLVLVVRADHASGLVTPAHDAVRRPAWVEARPPQVLRLGPTARSALR